MSELNPLNDLSRVYLDKVALMNRQEEQNDVERWQGILDDQMEKSSKELATLGAPQMEEETSYVETYVKELNKTGYPMEEEKKAAKDYDGDGKVESGKDEYFGSKDKAIKKAMGKKVKEENEENYNYVEAYVTELKKTTMGSYVSKASKNLSDRRFDQGRSEKATYEPDADDDKEEMKLRQREKGISRAAKKLSKEESEYIEVAQQVNKAKHKEDLNRWTALKESGKFSKEELEGMMWNEFDEGYQRDPEGGEEKERQAKRERKGGYDEKREKRMNDPKTGINSPAFREFMRSRGM